MIFDLYRQVEDGVYSAKIASIKADSVERAKEKLEEWLEQNLYHEFRMYAELWKFDVHRKFHYHLCHNDFEKKRFIHIIRDI